MGDLFKVKYTMEAFCENCGETPLIKIPKGTFIYDYLSNRHCVCEKCGCRIRNLNNDTLKPEELKQKHKKMLKTLLEKNGD